MKPLIFLSFLIGATFADAAIETLFLIGADDGDHAPFGSETSNTEPAPGSPLLRDDHYYASVPEPVENFERALTTWDPSITVHFDLTPEQASADGIFTFTIDFLWSGQSGGGTSSNEITCRLNGIDFLMTPTFESYQEFEAKVTAVAGLVQPGENTLEIARTGGSINTWVAIDFVQLDLDPTANQDSDEDGLPLYWETLYQLSDLNPTDAGESSDDDLLTNLEEFQTGTNPRDDDSDDDGLADHLEILTDPLSPDSDEDGLLDGEETSSSPILADTDGDGAFDAWEIRTGYDPDNNTSTPPPFSGAIGINFRSAAEEERGLWSRNRPNGWVPQNHWNQTELLRHWGVADGEPLLTGDTSEIETPVADTIVDAAGNALTTTISFTYDGCWYSSNSGTPAAELLHGFLRSDATFNPTIALANIPYANYDLYVYFSSDYLGPTGTLRVNGDSASERTLRARATSPTREFVPFYQVGGPNLPRYNTVRFPALTGSNLSLELIEVDGTTGIAGIQIVDIDVDTDGDLLPDYWEFQYQTDAGVSNSTADPDNDLLDNLGEFTRGTHPHEADTDQDGLSDFVESGSGTFIDSSDTGTSALFGDSDGDGLGDGDELNNPLASNPVLADSDNDGQSDLVEFTNNTDPTNAVHTLVPVPTFPAADTLAWQVNDIQLVQDHNTPANTEYGFQREIFSLNVTNAEQPGWRTLEFRLVEFDGRLGLFFIARGPGGFRHPDGYDLYHGDLVNDLRSALGLSGYGSCDISDRLTFELTATANTSPATDWTATFRIINQATSATVATHSFTNAVAASTVIDQTATWRDQEQILGQASLITGIGLEALQSSTSLETLPSFLPHLDSDNDGIPDWWESLHNLDSNDASDAVLDPDGDNLNNRQEFYHETIPSNPDSDGDGANDGEEFSQFTNPASASSQPPYLQNSPSFSPDQDGNGLPDIWEASYRATGLTPNGDEDFDGFSNAEEAVAGTNPLNPNSKPFLDIENLAFEMVRASWPLIPGKSQILTSSDNLTGWAPEGGSTSQTEAMLWQEIVADQEKRFFRVEFADQNSDDDTLNDWSELALGLSPTNSDSASRAVPYDSDNDGQADSTIAGDLAYWHSTFGNAQELRSGGPVAAPTPFDAARLLTQASFGPTMKDIEHVRDMGLENWIDDQILNQDPTRHSEYIEEIYRDFDGPRTQATYSFNVMDDFLNDGNINTAFARAAISGPDQLRQRVAFALSQIIVVSRRDANLNNRLGAISGFYDLLVEHAFGNYEDLLMEVTMHPTMGRYLSHIGNQPPAPELNRYPDENYARELMQLFTIGLWELEQDGSRKTDAAGEPIPTYSNDEITDFARVMTGLWYGGNPWGSGGWQDTDYAVPMEIHSDYHDFGPKTLLNGVVIPRRPVSEANALLDIEDAVRNLFEHQNCAPFVSRALIQFLVTSNPSPDYVGRISAIFADNGSGERGNLGAVVKAILLDPEARDPAVANSPEFGVFREPVIRTMHLARLTHLNRNNDLLWWDYGEYAAASFQQATASPSVFNFYRPDYKAPGVLTANNLVAPAMEITNSYSAVSFPNQLWQHANSGFSLYSTYSFPPDYSELLPFADDHDALLDYVNLVACAGHMTAQTRSIIRTALDNAHPVDDPGRVRLALYLALMSPHGAVQR